MLSNLGKRLLFVAWAVPLGWWFVNSELNILAWVSSDIVLLPAHILIVLLVMLSCYEYTKMLALVFPYNAFWLSYIWLALQFVVYFDKDTSLPLYLSFYVLLLLVAIESFIWGKKSQRRRWVRASLLFSGTAFLYVAAYSLLNMYKEPFQSLFISPSSHEMLSQLGVVIVMTSIFMCDSGAYLIGSRWGKTHFSSISPKKTIEGSIAGLVSAIVVSTIGWFFLASPEYPRWLGLVLGLLIGIMAQIGDLLVSLMKRYFRVKDASEMIPGHGGILDRFDSVFFTAPIISLFSWTVSRIFG
jgi:phosphatidate cytidylyltransferase